MITEWLSESISDEAKSAILLGAVDNQTISKLSKEFPSGILLFSSNNETTTRLPKQVTLINIKESPSLIKENEIILTKRDYSVGIRR